MAKADPIGVGGGFLCIALANALSRGEVNDVGHAPLRSRESVG